MKTALREQLWEPWLLAGETYPPDIRGLYVAVTEDGEYEASEPMPYPQCKALCAAHNAARIARDMQAAWLRGG